MVITNVIKYNVLTGLQKYGKLKMPREAIAILCSKSGKAIDRFFPITNIGLNNIDVDYLADPEEQFKALSKTDLLDNKSNLKFIGIFHTHPNGSNKMSETDIKYADFDCLYMIHSLTEHSTAMYQKNGSHIIKLNYYVIS